MTLAYGVPDLQSYSLAVDFDRPDDKLNAYGRFVVVVVGVVSESLQQSRLADAWMRPADLGRR